MVRSLNLTYCSDSKGDGMQYGYAHDLGRAYHYGRNAVEGAENDLAHRVHRGFRAALRQAVRDCLLLQPARDRVTHETSTLRHV